MNANSNHSRMRAVYDQIAPAFAREHAGMEADVLESGARFLALKRPSGPLLELGCGAGRDLAWFAALGQAMVGADLSMGMLAEARTRGQAPLVQMEMTRLGFLAAAFAGLWCNAALLHLPRAEAPAALAEMRRVLRPAGLLFLSLQEGEGEGWETRPNRPARLFARYHAAELEGLLAGAGFTVLSIHPAQAYDRVWLHAIARAIEKSGHAEPTGRIQPDHS
jgi:ubiquinone/menaquinone biosynthesis C-methylase UbiE